MTTYNFTIDGNTGIASGAVSDGNILLICLSSAVNPNTWKLEGGGGVTVHEGTTSLNSDSTLLVLSNSMGIFTEGKADYVVIRGQDYIDAGDKLSQFDLKNVLDFSVKNKLLLARVASLVIGAFGILLALKEIDLLELMMQVSSFYMPIVKVPFIMTAFGYRTPFKNAVLGGMSAGLATVLLWIYFDITVINAIAPAMLANFCTTIVMHWIYWNRQQLKTVKQ